MDVILDPSGTSLLEVDIEVAAPGGRIVLFGNPGGAQPAALPALSRLIPGAASFEAGACLGVPALTAHRWVFADGPVNGTTVHVTGGGSWRQRPGRRR